MLQSTGVDLKYPSNGPQNEVLMESVAISLTQVHVESSAMENTRLLPSLSAASLLILSLNSYATVLVYEGFNYTASIGIPTGTLNGGIGFGGAWNSAGNALVNASITLSSLAPANLSGLVTSGNFLNNHGGNNGGGTSFLDRNFYNASRWGRGIRSLVFVHRRPGQYSGWKQEHLHSAQWWVEHPEHGRCG